MLKSLFVCLDNCISLIFICHCISFKSVAKISMCVCVCIDVCTVRVYMCVHKNVPFLQISALKELKMTPKLRLNK